MYTLWFTGERGQQFILPKEFITVDGVDFYRIPPTPSCCTDGLYISMEGEVYDSLSKVKPDRTEQEGSHGYFSFTYVRHGVKYSLLFHRAMGLTFILNPENKPEVNHIDNDRHNYSLENLEWVTPEENVTHCCDFGDKYVRSFIVKDHLRERVHYFERVTDVYKQFGIYYRHILVELEKGLLYNHRYSGMYGSVDMGVDPNQYDHLWINELIEDRHSFSVVENVWSKPVLFDGYKAIGEVSDLKGGNEMQFVKNVQRNLRPGKGTSLSLWKGDHTNLVYYEDNPELECAKIINPHLGVIDGNGNLTTWIKNVYGNWDHNGAKIKLIAMRGGRRPHGEITFYFHTFDQLNKMIQDRFRHELEPVHFSYHNLRP